MVATNTKFTSEAIHYASCAGLELLSWEYPEGRDLHELISAAKLYPVTALTTLSRNEKMALLKNNLVLCAQVPHNKKILAHIGIHGQRADTILEEAGALCMSGKDI
jgi:hypothetical protein